MSIVEELRNKQSRDNRELLDRAADRIEELEKAKAEVAREIFAELWDMVIPEKCTDGCAYYLDMAELTELEKKYTEDTE